MYNFSEDKNRNFLKEDIQLAVGIKKVFSITDNQENLNKSKIKNLSSETGMYQNKTQE